MRFLANTKMIIYEVDQTHRVASMQPRPAEVVLGKVSRCLMSRFEISWIKDDPLYKGCTPIDCRVMSLTKRQLMSQQVIGFGFESVGWIWAYKVTPSPIGMRIVEIVFYCGLTVR